MLGFITSLLLSVLPAAGSLTDMTSGLAAATIFDPISETQEPGHGERLQRDHDHTAVLHRDGRPAHREGLHDLFRSVG